MSEDGVEAHCENCGQRTKFPAAMMGQVADCPNCNSYVDVPNRPGEATAIDWKNVDVGPSPEREVLVKYVDAPEPPADRTRPIVGAIIFGAGFIVLALGRHPCPFFMGCVVAIVGICIGMTRHR